MLTTTIINWLVILFMLPLLIWHIIYQVPFFHDEVVAIILLLLVSQVDAIIDK